MFSEPDGTREARKKMTGERILEVAKKIFESDGFENATIRKIAAAAEVSPGNVIHHYGDKLELLYAALYSDRDQVIGEAIILSSQIPKKDRRKGRYAITATMVLFGHVLAYYKTRPDLSKIMLKESFFSGGSWALRFRGQAEKAAARLIKIVGEALDLGEFRAEINPRLTAASLISFYYFSLLSWISEPASDPKRMCRTLVEDYLKNLADNQYTSGVKRK